MPFDVLTVWKWKCQVSLAPSIIIVLYFPCEETMESRALLGKKNTTFLYVKKQVLSYSNLSHEKRSQTMGGRPIFLLEYTTTSPIALSVVKVPDMTFDFSMHIILVCKSKAYVSLSYKGSLFTKEVRIWQNESTYPNLNVNTRECV